MNSTKNSSFGLSDDKPKISGVFWSIEKQDLKQDDFYDLTSGNSWFRSPDFGWEELLNERFNREFTEDVHLPVDLDIRHFWSVQVVGEFIHFFKPRWPMSPRLIQCFRCRLVSCMLAESRRYLSSTIRVYLWGNLSTSSNGSPHHPANPRSSNRPHAMPKIGSV